ncbi:YdbL family protein [Oleiagrimonas sp. C23AA]|uniref:YdbL family protein n=1 Tax=Oleiagrimonas sp. C23AA TaxID=2719047 RepID=UPI001423912E|nr:YdbL family protein [Oleiagrimonas sp. C23AA]NII10400.1 YdbL family protein [Oleiagrimonas sp. C23AA]
MRKAWFGLMALVAVSLIGCVTINVYFPEAAAKKAADQFIGSVLSEQATAQPQDQKDADKSQQQQPPGNQPSASVFDLLIPAAHAASPNLRIHTPAIDKLHDAMKQRFQQHLKSWLNDGAVGFTQDGMVAVRDAGKVPLSQRAALKSTVAAENRDRQALYREIANANGHPDWQSDIRSTFAQLWIKKAQSGWYYRDASGHWKRK